MFLIMVIYMKMSICNHLNTNQGFPADRVTPRGATRATSSAIEPASLSLHSPRCRRAQPQGKACVVAVGGGPPPSHAGVSGWSGAAP
jgi:hypothetical protein